MDIDMDMDMDMRVRIRNRKIRDSAANRAERSSTERACRRSYKSWRSEHADVVKA